MTVELRAAEPGDLEAVARVFLACWQGPYAAFLPPGAARLYDGGAAAELWRPQLAGSGGEVTVAIHRGKRVGMVAVKPDEGYLASLYVEPALQGSGVGRRLFDHALARCRAAGAREMRWWVFSANRQARRFYVGRGALPSGRSRVQPAYGLEEVELRRPTGPQ